jgi:glycosyltransferase involved in cell wall biosynthesis
VREKKGRCYPLAYLILHFPKRSEQFIAREVAGMARRIGPLLVYSLQEPEGDPPQDPGIRVRYLSREPAGRVAAAHFRLLFHSPPRWIRTMWEDVGRDFLRALAPGVSASKRRRTFRRTRLYLRCAIVAEDLLRGRTCHLHAHYAHHPAEAARRISKLTGIPFSFTAHAKDLFLTKPRKLNRLVREASFAVTCTRDGQAYLRGICRDRHSRKIYCRNHGLPLENFRPSPRAGGESHPPVLLSVGRFIEKKGFDTLLEAAAVLFSRGREFRCVLAGNGRLGSDLLGRAERLGLNGRVSFPGFLSQEQLLAHYQEAAALVLACRRLPDGNRDGIPNVILEAMACGLPVVATRVGGIPEVVRPGENGLLVEPDRPADLADALGRLLADPVLSARMGSRGREMVLRRFDLERSTRHLLRLFLKRCPALARYARPASRGDSLPGAADTGISRRGEIRT